MMMEVDVSFWLGLFFGAMWGVILALFIDIFRVGRVIEDYQALEQEIWAFQDECRCRKRDDREGKA